MRIVNRETFEKLPGPVLFAFADVPADSRTQIGIGDPMIAWPRKPCSTYLDINEIKVADDVDDYAGAIGDALVRMVREGASYPLDLDMAYLETEYDREKWYAVYERGDLLSLIELLQAAADVAPNKGADQ